MAYRTILTTYGLQRLAAATAAGVPINLVAMAVGDGNGNPVTPVESQTQLVGEKYRAPVNRVYQDPNLATKFITELIIPAAVGGFVVREAGVYDDAGGLFAVANVPNTYKPTPDEGAFADAAVRLAFLATNASVVTLQVDPNVAIATHQWVINNITAATLIPGGTTGQVLAKAGNADGDYVWSDPTVANVVVDVIEEQQTLADAQTTVTWATVTTRGLAVYIEGVRLAKGLAVDEWIEDPAQPDTRIILGASYPAGTQIIGTQNEPSGSVPFPLIRDQNLGDVPDKAMGRQNLDVFSKSETRQMAPTSEIAYFARTTAPAGWLKANGAAVSRAAYSDLFAVIGTAFGAGDGFTTFNLPDLRGEFMRGWDDGRGVDGGRALGSGQAHAFGSHNHGASSDAQGAHSHGGATSGVGDHQHVSPYGGSNLSYPWGNYGGNQAGAIENDSDNVWPYTSPAGAHAHSISVDGLHAHNISISWAGANETRPRNVAMLACIKF